MENKDKKPCPWYDDRVTLLHEEATASPGGMTMMSCPGMRSSPAPLRSAGRTAAWQFSV